MGRHSAQDDGKAASARPAPPRSGRPKPGRHHVGRDAGVAPTASATTTPPGDALAESTGPIRAQTTEPRPVGLDVIEAAMNDGAVRGAGPAAAPADETVTIPTVTAAVLDEPTRKPTPRERTQQTPAEADRGTTATLRGGDGDVASDGPRTDSTQSIPAVGHDEVSDTRSTDTAASTAPVASDLALLRAHTALRARVLAAILVPFLVYTVVLVVTAHSGLRTFLIWIWVPLVTAGVLAGLLLDAAHRSGPRSESE